MLMCAGARAPNESPTLIVWIYSANTPGQETPSKGSLKACPRAWIVDEAGGAHRKLGCGGEVVKCARLLSTVVPPTLVGVSFAQHLDESDAHMAQRGSAGPPRRRRAF